MKERADLTIGLIKKADSDKRAADITLQGGSYDAAAFHSQQAIEKYLKAYLTSKDADFPYTHNLSRLLELCAGFDSGFLTLLETVEPLSSYAVELRYESDMWPTEQAATEATTAIDIVRSFLRERLPAELFPNGEGAA